MNAEVMVAGKPIDTRMKAEVPPLGAAWDNGRCSFCVWAPFSQEVDLLLVSPEEKEVTLTPVGDGYHAIVIEDIEPGTRYGYRLDGGPLRPDPVSRFQPGTVHEPSAVVDPRFAWTDEGWRGLPLEDYVLYELHVGTATRGGTFEALIPRLAYFKELGVTALEIMPVAQFPGRRNWGYDGVLPFAVQNSYGGPTGLKRLVDAAHREGLAVVLDVVYNHFGPEGNYLREFGPYFTERHHTPWGDAVNFDGPDNGAVRRFFLQNARQWQSEFHIDALRLDAVHAMVDNSALPFLQELARETHREARRCGRRCYLIAESDLNDARLIRPEMVGGMGLDAQWADDFHHALHVLLTGERDGYYADFGGCEQLGKAFEQAFVYDGSHSTYRKRRHGSPPFLTGSKQFVVYAQNHDQIGNRLLGERLSRVADFESQKLAAGAVILSPYLPLLFMGEEYGETAPFQYFVSHSSEELKEAVRQGRRNEFADFGWAEEMPDPCHETAFESCVIRGKPEDECGETLLKLYRTLLQLRRKIPLIRKAEKRDVKSVADEKRETLAICYCGEHGSAALVMNFAVEPREFTMPSRPDKWATLLDTADTAWHGPGRLARRGQRGLLLQPRSLMLLSPESAATVQVSGRSA